MRGLSQKVKQVAKGVQDTVRLAFRGVINLVNSGEGIQKVQVSGLADETIADVEFMQQFGLTSVPPAGTQVVVIPVGGATTHSVVVATENGSFRVKNLKVGEVAVYDESGSSIVLRNGKLIEVECDRFVLKCKEYSVNATSSAKFDTPLLETSQVMTAQGQINGNGGMAVQGGSGATFSGNVVQSGGSFTTDGDVTANGTSLKNHTHRAQGERGVTTSPI